QRLLVVAGRQTHRLPGGGRRRRRGLVRRRPVPPGREAAAVLLSAPRQGQRQGAPRHHPGRGRRDGLGRVGREEVRVPGERPLGTRRWTRQDRRHQAVPLLGVDPATGKTRVLVQEKDAAWLPPYQDVPRWLEGGDFLWTVQTAAGPQLQRYTADGALRKTIVP